MSPIGVQPHISHLLPLLYIYKMFHDNSQAHAFSPHSDCDYPNVIHNE